MTDIELLKKNLETLKHLREADAEQLAHNTLQLISSFATAEYAEIKDSTDSVLIMNESLRQRMTELMYVIEVGMFKLRTLERQERRSAYEG